MRERQEDECLDADRKRRHVRQRSKIAVPGLGIKTKNTNLKLPIFVIHQS